METQTDWIELIKSGEIYNIGNNPPPEPETPSEPKKYRADIQAFIDAADKMDPKIKHYSPDRDKLSDERKCELCTRVSNITSLIKLPSGDVKRIPYYCNLCHLCYAANALELKDKIDTFQNLADNAEKEGQWRKKIVDEGTEAQSLKKRIKRNQDDARFEIACEQAGKIEIWSYVTDEPGRNNNEIYGEVSDPATIDHEALYTRNRETGKKLSKGSAFKQTPSVAKKEDTIRLTMPQIMVKDVRQQEDAARIIQETNYVEIAKDADHAARLYTFQFKYILQELKAAGIEIAAIKLKYYNMAKDDLLKEWNKNVKFWMSINTSKVKNQEAKVDKVDMDAHLIFGDSPQQVVH